MSDEVVAKPRGNAGRGRPKGAQNKTTKAAREAILLAVDMMGGAEKLKKWVEAEADNERLFWTIIFPKLLPRETPAAETKAAEAKTAEMQVYAWLPTLKS